MRAVAASRGIEVNGRGDKAAARLTNPDLRRPLRQRTAAALLGFGLPSLPRRGSVLFLSYWPLVPLLDRLLRESPHPAVWLQKRPAGPKRTMRAAMRGGWIGAPGPWTQGRARAQARTLLGATRDPTSLEIEGLELGPSLHAQVLAMARRRTAGDLATATLFRRAFAKGKIDRVVVPYDLEPQMRLISWLAKEAGVPSLLVAHGAYPLRHTLVDMTVADEVALWSTTFGPSEWSYDRPLHVVGYPVPTRVAEVRDPPTDRPPRILVLGRAKETQTSLLDDRYAMRSYKAAVEGAAAVFPDAAIILRPAPSEGLATGQRVIAEFPSLELELDPEPDLEASMTRCDVCIGTASTATFQAALAGTPVITLNLSGYDWCWPLGGQTEVPIARSADELAEYLRLWVREGTLPGREQLLDALGVKEPDPVGHLLRLLRR